jgi:hypothetical protein
MTPPDLTRIVSRSELEQEPVADSGEDLGKGRDNREIMKDMERSGEIPTPTPSCRTA